MSDDYQRGHDAMLLEVVQRIEELVTMYDAKTAEHAAIYARTHGQRARLAKLLTEAVALALIDLRNELAGEEPTPPPKRHLEIVPTKA